MAASPRPAATRPRPRRRRAAALTVCAALAVTAAVVATTRPSTTHRPTAAATAAPPPAPAPVRTTVPPRRPAPPAVPHETVAAAVPTAFTLTGPAFTITAHVCSMAPVFPLDPPGEQHHTVCWVTKGFGVKPGSNSATSYVLGHSWAEDEQEVLNKASEAATRQILHTKAVTRYGVPVYPVHALDGYRLVLHTSTGTLTYVVRDAYGVAKDQLGLIRSTMDQSVHNRVVVITCAELHHVDYEYNVVIDAYLWSSTARVPSTA